MNNILTYDQYKGKVRLYEMMVINQELDDEVNEGLFTNIKKKMASNFVNNALKEEVEQGEKFEKLVKESIDDLKKMYDELDKSGKLSGSSDLTKKVEKMFDDINEMHFDTMSLLESADIDFGGFIGSVAMANVINIGVLFAPIRNTWMVRKSYQYFMGLIKETIRKDLILLQINFDKFQNTILKSVDDIINDSANASLYEEAMKEGESFLENTLKSHFGHKHWDRFIKSAEKWEKIKKEYRDRKRIEKKENPYNNIWDKLWDNTYTQTAETLKSFSSDDSAKQLEAIKTSISKISARDEDLTLYGELLIANAEEKALSVSTSIHNNFLKMSEVFKLNNQKKLVELIEQSEMEEKKKLEKEKKEFDDEKQKQEADNKIKEGKNVFNNKGVSSFRDIEEWYKLEDEDREKIISYLISEDGKDDYKGLNRKIKIVIPKDNSILESILDTFNLISVDSKNSKLTVRSGYDDEVNKVFKKLMGLKETSRNKKDKKRVDLYIRLLSDIYGIDKSYNKKISSYLYDIYYAINNGSIETDIDNDNDLKDISNYMKDIKTIIKNGYLPNIEKKSED